MYRSIYKQIAEETTANIRENEHRAFEHSIMLLKLAGQAGRGSRESVDALLYVNRLWGVLLEDLANPANGLPDSLKASLISIGIWMLRRAEDIRLGKSEDFAALIDVSETIRGGLSPA